DARFAEAFSDISSSFLASDYTPPFWARNAHVHTIVASGDFEHLFLGDRLAPVPYRRERWTLPDGDWIDVDWLVAEDVQEAPEEAEQVIDPNEVECGEQRSQLPGSDLLAEAEVASSHISLPSLPTSLRSLTPLFTLLFQALAGAMDNGGLGLGGMLGPHSFIQDLRDVDPQKAPHWTDSLVEEGQESNRRLILLLHGLESSSTAPMTMRQVVVVYAAHGYDVLALNFRSCSGTFGQNPLGYHLGYTDDLEHVLKEVKTHFSHIWSRVYLSGFSLGSGVIVNLLGKYGESAMSDLGVFGASVACVPFAPKASINKLEQSKLGQLLYIPAFLSYLLPKAEAHAEKEPELITETVLKETKKFSEFNEKIVAPLHGYESVEHYYNSVDATHHLKHVRVPLMVVNARDDPLIEGSTLPDASHVGDAPVRLVYHDHGGHCGFLRG
ncbi:unnamed protein product, partial [Chrysoparadoxa australica]